MVKKLKSDEAGNIELQVPLIKKPEKNKNDLIFFILLFTYILLINIYNKKMKKNSFLLQASPFQKVILIKFAIGYQVWLLINICL